ncbi:MAG: twin-arginine translocase TatA/TatE family subunit [Candidatus Kapabacteria bacterium]|nr:twin-arginine translocase TatA/TatE family subunit [Candidatus Kapabacteria bacterium]
MFDVGGGELILIVLAILVFFGPKKIPEVAQMVGRGMRKIRQAQDELTTQFREMSVEQPISPATTSQQPAVSPTIPEEHQMDDPFNQVDIQPDPLPDLASDKPTLESLRITPQPHPDSIARTSGTPTNTDN